MINLSENIIDNFIEMAIKEDVKDGDITTSLVVSNDKRAKAFIEFKEEGILAGLSIAEKVFHRFDKDLSFTAFNKDGDYILGKGVVAKIEGKAAPILTAERTALNFLQYLSGIATSTRKYTDQLIGTKTVLLDTRKTLPGWRALAKYAVLIGGGKNHRQGLFDAILIKNNHLKFTSSITEAINRAKNNGKSELEIEVEVENLVQFEEALKAGADIIMLDNMTPEDIKKAVVMACGKVKTEISGGVNLENIKKYAHLGADFISVGALTHSVKALDIHLNVLPD